MRAFLEVVERNLDDELGPHVDGERVTRDLQLQELLGLPGEHVVGQSLERLAEHDEAAALRVPGAEVQVAQRAAAAAVSPFGGEHDQVQACARTLHLSQAWPRRPAAYAASGAFAITPS